MATPLRAPLRLDCFFLSMSCILFFSVRVWIRFRMSSSPAEPDVGPSLSCHRSMRAAARERKKAMLRFTMCVSSCGRDRPAVQSCLDSRSGLFPNVQICQVCQWPATIPCSAASDSAVVTSLRFYRTTPSSNQICRRLDKPSSHASSHDRV